MSGKSGGFFASKGYKNLMKVVYGYGASVVILGALFKIMHWPFCDVMLIIGLSTEAVIFALSAMEPLHSEPNWAVYYPYLLPEDERPQSAEELEAFPKPMEIGGGSGSAGTGITEQFDDLLAKAKIDQALLDRLASYELSGSDIQSVCEKGFFLQYAGEEFAEQTLFDLLEEQMDLGKKSRYQKSTGSSIGFQKLAS